MYEIVRAPSRATARHERRPTPSLAFRHRQGPAHHGGQATAEKPNYRFVIPTGELCRRRYGEQPAIRRLTDLSEQIEQGGA
jgi:hypothetical protein